jgi:hypothetical protein
MHGRTYRSASRRPTMLTSAGGRASWQMNDAASANRRLHIMRRREGIELNYKNLFRLYRMSNEYSCTGPEIRVTFRIEGCQTACSIPLRYPVAINYLGIRRQRT